jgi:hypothetical protein
VPTIYSVALWFDAGVTLLRWPPLCLGQLLMQRAELDAANGVIEAADLAFGLDKLPACTVQVSADEAEMLFEFVEIFAQAQ